MPYLFTILPRHGTPVIGVCFADLKTAIKSKKTRTLLKLNCTRVAIKNDYNCR